MKNTNNYIYLFVLLLLVSCQKQKNKNGKADSLTKTAIEVQTNTFDKYFDEDKYQEIINEGDIFLESYKDSLSNDSIGWATLHHWLGVAHRNIRPQSEAHHQSLSFHFAQAEALRKQISGQQKSLTSTYLNWAIGEKNYGNYSFAAPFYKKAYQYYISEQKKQDTLRVLGSLAGLIVSYTHTKEDELVRKYFNQAESYFKNIKKINYPILLEYNTILLWFANHKMANAEYEIALEKLNQAKNLGIDTDIPQTNLQIIRCKISLGQFDAAMKDSYHSIAFLETQPIIDSLTLAGSYLYLGQCYKEKKKYSKALYFSEKIALPIFIKINNKEELGNFCYTKIAQIYIAQKNYPHALDNYQNAIRTVNLNFNSKKWIDNPIDTSLKYCQVKVGLAESFLVKAQMLKIIATQTKSTIYLEAAWQTYQTLNTLQALIRAEISTEKSKMNLGKQQDWVADALKIAKELQAKNPQKDYLSAAYAIVQNTKAQVMNEHLQGERGKVLANISEAEQDKERLLLAEMSQLRKQLLDEPNDATLPQKALAAEQKYYDYQENLAKQYPIFSKTKFDNKALSIKEIQDNLSDDVAVLDYLPTKDSLHIFCINPYRLTWKTVAISKSDKTNIDSLQHTQNQVIDEIKTPKSAAFLLRSHAAYRCLIAPIEHELLGIKRLRIIPAAWVGVGFESLCSSPYAGNWSDKKIPFMIRNYAISYLFSIKELLPKPRKKTTGSVSVGSFGISYSDGLSFQSSRSPDSCLQFLNGTRGGGKLNFAVKEAKDVSALWGVGDCILEKKATKKEFINRCKSSDYNVLHLAMHGIPECDDPNNIQLVFSKDATNKDNLMRIYEIAGLRMHSDLAVLSACHSGAGQLENYEGVLSLGRAFAMAGCESLITSNSSVIDETSPHIFDSFYKKLKNDNMTKDVALQKAVCDYLDNKSDMERIPYRWSNFHLWGNVDAIQGDSPNFFQRYWKYLLGTVLLFGFFYLYKVLKVRYL